MSKYGRQHRERQRRATRAQTQKFEEDALWRPNAEEPSEEERQTDYPTATAVVSQRVVRSLGSGQIIEFAVTYWDVDADGKRCEMLCIDTCNHGSVHRHRDGDHDSDPEVIKVITSQSVVQNAYWEAIGEAYDQVNWQTEEPHGRH